ncbi:MAG: phosphotransferase, partial [Candidatus Lindowbacteria bacterium]|nr:phosphotransferase [Candidatus Lindowbacteria bacterium]
PEGTSLAAIRKQFPRAAIVWAHPYRDENRPPAVRLLNPLLDGIEIFSSNHSVLENSRGLQDWHRYRFTAIGGTDTHAPSYAGTYPTIFDHPIATIEELAAELRAGRCRHFVKEIPKAGTTSTEVLDVTIGTKGADEVRERIIIKTQRSFGAWKSAERTFHVMRELGRRCFTEGTYRVPKALGHDKESMSIFEEGVRGRSLFDTLVKADAQDARRYLRMAAYWLARLHNCRLQITPPEEFLESEEKRCGHYLNGFIENKHKQTRRVREIVEAVLDIERTLFQSHPERLTQGHGDFHPKNIYIGKDKPGNGETTFVAAIDFSSSHCMPPAFDVGAFMAQFRNQFFHRPEVLEKFRGGRGDLSDGPAERLFLNTYLEAAEDIALDFLSQVELFKARTGLSIAYYLLKVGMGDSEDLWRVLVDAERALANFSASKA